jgi:drug/metabolite transporter (DMT)-like permease
MVDAMTARQWTLLLVLAATWGASYLFIKVALADFSPASIVFIRTALAALVLLPVALRRDALRGLRPVAGAIALLALVQVAGPFMLISVGEQTISSSLTGILVASAPIFTALLALWVDHEERSGGWRLLGVLVGITGVAVLLGVDVGDRPDALAGAAMVLLAGAGYAIGGFIVKRRFAAVQPVGLVAATMAVSALALLLPALLTQPAEIPSPVGTASLVALGALGTGLAFLIFYTLIAEAGPARASLVAYIAPGFAVLWGVVLLGERVTVSTVAGLALILGGSWLAAGRRARGAPMRGVRARATPEAAAGEP